MDGCTAAVLVLIHVRLCNAAVPARLPRVPRQSGCPHNHALDQRRRHQHCHLPVVSPRAAPVGGRVAAAPGRRVGVTIAWAEQCHADAPAPRSITTYTTAFLLRLPPRLSDMCSNPVRAV